MFKPAITLLMILSATNSFAWHKYRYIECSSKKKCQQQQRIFDSNLSGVKERKLKVKLNPVIKEYRLIGLDEGVKKTSKKPFDLKTLFSVIDSMPMRQAEMTKEESR